MRLQHRLQQTIGLLFCGMLLGLTVALAQHGSVKWDAQQPTAHSNHHGFFSRQTYQVEPKIEAVLLLTAEQHKKMNAILNAIMEPLALREAHRKREERRSGKRPADEERKVAQLRYGVQMIQGLREAQKRWKSLLTAEQTAIIEKVDSAVASVMKELSATYDAPIKTSDMNERKRLEQERDEKIQGAVAVRLDAVLSEAQKEALRKAKV